MAKERRLVTVALPYTNNVPHIGNIVGSHLPGDIFARFCRLKGYETILIGGTDEHGTATEIAAQKYGITPKELCDHFYEIHKEIYDWFNISYDNFSRTSREIHYKTTTDFFMKVHKNGFIVEKALNLPYCKECERQLSDRYVEGTCPHCGYENARGDQCENCSNMLDPEHLKKPRCGVCGSKKIDFHEKKHLFLDLHKLSPQLKKWINSNKHWRDQVRNLALSWIEEGLKPRCITRDLKWGIEVPIKGFEDLIFYVWFDAPIGYISSTKEKFPKTWQKFWQDSKTKTFQFIGKDNIPFHTIFFPGMILANGEYNLPYNVVGLQYLNYERSKFSKSKGWGVFCENLPTAGLDADYWRFYLSYLIPETKDTEFLWHDFQQRINAELIGNFGNFINRALKFIWNNFDGKIPDEEIDKKFKADVDKHAKETTELFEKVELRMALLEILKLSDMGNKYFEENEPWKDKDKKVLFNCANLCKTLALLIQPFIPESSEKIIKMLKCNEKDWSKVTEFNLKNHKINKPEVLFEKIEDKRIEELKIKTSKITEYFKEEKKMVEFSEWEKMELKVGEIKEVKDHPDADKLFILKVDTGEERQLVAGIKGHYKKEDLVGQKIIVFTNLKPATLRGVESQGMLLAADDGKNIVLLEPEKKIKNGAKIR